jgi:hypothetical protein
VPAARRRFANVAGFPRFSSVRYLEQRLPGALLAVSLFQQELLTMNQFKNPWLSLAALVVALVSFPSQAFARGYNCKSDKVVDKPMQLAVDIESAGRVHLSAYGGSDKSGWIAPYNNGAWRVYDSSGKQLTRFTDSLFLFASTDLLRETYLEGLVPGSYSIDLTSMDFCGNLGHSKGSFTIQTPVPEANDPAISDLQVVMVGSFGATAYTLYFTATDDTGIKHLSVSVNGSPIAEFNYFNGTSFRWWTALYPADGTLTAFEGPSFSLMYPDAYKGQCGVQVTGEDLFGNQFTATSQVCLP